MKRIILLPVLLATFLTLASADTITILSAASIANATAERDASLSVMPGSLSSSGVGTHHQEFTILNSSETPFSGRYNTTPGGYNWLDSNDVTKLQLTTSFDSLYFFMTDVNDMSGRLRIQTADGTTFNNFTQHAANGNLYFVGITSPDPIGYIRWLTTSQADGFGLDDFGTPKYPAPAPVPEPATWIVAAVALLILAAAVEQRGRQRASPEQSSKGRRESRRRGR